MVVHATKLSANVQSKMVAVVVFGVRLHQAFVMQYMLRNMSYQDPNKKFGSLAVPLNNAQCFIR